MIDFRTSPGTLQGSDHMPSGGQIDASLVEVRPDAERDISSLGMWMGVGRRWDVSAVAAVAVVAVVALGGWGLVRAENTPYLMNSVLIL